MEQAFVAKYLQTPTAAAGFNGEICHSSEISTNSAHANALLHGDLIFWYRFLYREISVNSPGLASASSPRANFVYSGAGFVSLDKPANFHRPGAVASFWRRDSLNGIPTINHIVCQVLRTNSP